MWHILGLEPTNDKKLIKKAYAKKLKSVSPEDDPDGFQELRSAYEWAMGFSGNSLPDTHDEQNERVPTLNVVALQGDLQQLSSTSSLEEWDAFLAQGNTLCLEDKVCFEKTLADYLGEHINEEGEIRAQEYQVSFFDLIDRYFHWRNDTAHLEKLMGPTAEYYNLLDCVQRLEKPSKDELIELLIPLFIDPNINTQRQEWVQPVQRITLLPKKERRQLSGDIFQLLTQFATHPQFSILPEGLNALDRLFGWTFPKNPKKRPWMKTSLKKKLNDQTAFLEKQLYDARRSVSFPLCEEEYQKSIYQWCGELLIFALAVNALLKTILKHVF